MHVQIFLVVVYRDVVDDFGRERARFLYGILARRIEPPDDPDHEHSNDHQKTDAAFSFAACRASEFHLKTEAGSFDDIAVADESFVLLHAGVGAKTIAGIHLELNQIPKDAL